MKILRRIGKFLRRWNELLSIPLGFLLWYLSPPLLRSLDPTAATFDAGVFQAILFAIIAFLIIHGVAWLVLKLSWWTVYNTLDNLPNLFHKNELTVWQKLKFSLSLFFSFVFIMALLVNAIV